MSEESTRLDRFLATDPRDVGCAAAMQMLSVFCDLATSGRSPEERFPGVAAHLEACEPCGEDFAGLLAALATRRADTRLHSKRRPPDRR
jgi:anti-sigma factor RsiW